MRLGINATFLNETPTGVGVYTREVAARLCALNEDTVIFTSVSLDGISDPCIEKTTSSIRGSFRLLPNILRFVHANTQLPLLSKKRGIDVLYCPLVEFPFVPSGPLVVTVHDLHPVYFPHQFGLSAKHFSLSLRLLTRIAGRVIVPSGFAKRELLRLVPIVEDRVDVVPNGYNSALFRPWDKGMNEDFLGNYGIMPPFILFVGSLFPYKNVGGLVSAFLRIKDRIPHKLVIIGKKELSSGPLHEDRRIIYLDYVRNKDLPGFYSFADMVVHPSLAEGFGMTILEAMACGTPVIVSNKGSLPEVAGDAGKLFDPDDQAALEAAIIEVAGNGMLRKDLVRRGLSHVRNFSWERTASGVFRSCVLALEHGK